jgi:hypothetical protein
MSENDISNLLVKIPASIKYRLVNGIANAFAMLISKSNYLTEIARRAVRTYDNDANDNREKNGEKKLQKLIASSSDSNSLILDVGANVGDWSADLIDCGYKGRLVALDPLSKNLSKTREKLNALNYSNFELVESALSDKVEKLKFFIHKEQYRSGSDSLFNITSVPISSRTNSIG